MSSRGYLVSEYTFHITYLLPYSGKLRTEICKISLVFSGQILQVVHGFVSSFRFWELKLTCLRFTGMNKLVQSSQEKRLVALTPLVSVILSLDTCQCR